MRKFKSHIYCPFPLLFLHNGLPLTRTGYEIIISFNIYPILWLNQHPPHFWLKWHVTWNHLLFWNYQISWWNEDVISPCHLERAFVVLDSVLLVERGAGGSLLERWTFGRVDKFGTLATWASTLEAAAASISDENGAWTWRHQPGPSWHLGPQS